MLDKYFLLFIFYSLRTRVLIKLLITTFWQLSKLHFSAPKMSDFLNLNWGGAGS